MRTQLRPFYPAAKLDSVYPQSYDHKRWPDHILRVNFTIHFARYMAHRFELKSVTDLSCGDGVIAKGIGGMDRVTLGDFVEAPHLDVHGRIEDTVRQIASTDLFILSETLEHVEDPDELLRLIRKKAKAIVVTTPEGEDNDLNPEHYWGWDQNGVRAMLVVAGWTPVLETLYDPAYGYTFQMWGCV